MRQPVREVMHHGTAAGGRVGGRDVSRDSRMSSAADSKARRNAGKRRRVIPGGTRFPSYRYEFEPLGGRCRINWTDGSTTVERFW